MKNSNLVPSDIDIDKIKEETRTYEELVDEIIKQLEHFARTLDFKAPAQDHSEVFKTLASTIPLLEEQSTLRSYKRLLNLKKTISDKLQKRNKNVTTVNYQVESLKNIINNIETIVAAHQLGIDGMYEGQAFNFVKYLLLERRNIYEVTKLFDEFPHLINLKDNDQSLLDLVVKEQIKEIEDYTCNSQLKNSDVVLYYDQLLRYILSHPKHKKRQISLRKNYERIQESLKSRLENFNNDELKRKYIFWMNSLDNNLSGLGLNLTKKSLLYMTDIEEEFDEAIKTETKILVRKSRNFLNMHSDAPYLIVIDYSSNALELDDAISISKIDDLYRLGVHIANPLYYIDTRSILFDEAMNRTTSIYLNKKNKLPMFPSELSQELFSIKNQKVNPMNSYYFIINEAGEIVSYYFVKENLRVQRFFDCNQFNEICEGKTFDAKLDEMVDSLLQVKNILKKTNKIDQTYEMYKRQEFNVSATNIIGTGHAQDIVEQAMLITNKTVAEHFYQHSFPYLYRNHMISQEETRRLNYFQQCSAAYPELCGTIDSLKETYPEAFYGLDNKGHFGLGVLAYGHITAPIRRLSDILNSECLNRFYFKEATEEDYLFAEELLKRGSEQINRKSKQIQFLHKNYRNANRD